MDSEAWLSNLLPGEVRGCKAFVHARGEEPVAVRVIAVRLPPEQAARSRAKARVLSERKGHTPRRATLFLADFVTVVTNLTDEELSDHETLEAYRWRWQIELAFKRFKSTTLIRHLVNQKDEMVLFYIRTALSIWLLTERVARESAFFPWGYPLRRGAEPRLGGFDEVV